MTDPAFACVSPTYGVRSMAETGYTIPTLAELVNRISGDLASRLPGRDTRLRRTIVWALAIVLAGAS